MSNRFARAGRLLFTVTTGVGLLFGATQAFAHAPSEQLACPDPYANGTCFSLTECQSICEFLGMSANGAVCNLSNTCCYCRY